MVLGLVAMVTSVDSLYASMKFPVCIAGNNQLALKEMERMGGFQVGQSYTVLLFNHWRTVVRYVTYTCT